MTSLRKLAAHEAGRALCSAVFPAAKVSFRLTQCGETWASQVSMTVRPEFDDEWLWVWRLQWAAAGALAQGLLLGQQEWDDADLVEFRQASRVFFERGYLAPARGWVTENVNLFLRDNQEMLTRVAAHLEERRGLEPDDVKRLCAGLTNDVIFVPLPSGIYCQPLHSTVHSTTQK